MSRAAIAPVVLVLAACGADVTSPSSNGGDACAAYSTAPPAPAAVTVRLVNRTATPLYLGQTSPGCDDGVEFTLKDGAGAELVHDLDACDSTCARLRQDSCACAAGCAMPSVWLLAPGGERAIAWRGSVFRATTMPASCQHDAQCASAPCYLEELPPAGPLTLAAAAHTEAGACDGPGGKTCTCTPDASGSCRVDGVATVGGARVDATATWSGETTVEIAFH